MNLRDKLKAIETPRADLPRQPAAPVSAGCWEGRETRASSDFPHESALNRECVMLMQGEAMPDPFSGRRILYLDTETTGLSGGAGTVAFLVGLGWMTEDGFEIRQYVMRDYPEEKAVLARVAEAFSRFDCVCTFNGRAFDLPLLKDRFLMNRMSPACLEVPHIDLMHIARRVWKLRLGRCNLSRLEEVILGFPRLGDLPGSEVPQRYFDFLKTGQFSLLQDVLTHNAQDVATLCTLLYHMAYLYEHPESQLFGEDLFSMGAALERFRHPEEARRCFRLCTQGKMRAESQLRLAQSWRRSGERGQARAVWEHMIERREGGVTPYVELAKHYEHVEKNLPAALEMTRRAMAQLSEPTLLDSEGVQEARNALQYRYDRLKRRREQKET